VSQFTKIKLLHSNISEEPGGLCCRLTYPAPKIAPVRPDLSYDTGKICLIFSEINFVFIKPKIGKFLEKNCNWCANWAMAILAKFGLDGDLISDMFF